MRYQSTFKNSMYSQYLYFQYQLITSQKKKSVVNLVIT